MKPIEHGGLEFESQDELQTAIAAIDEVVRRAEEQGEFADERAVYWLLRGALADQLAKKEAEERSGKESEAFAILPQQFLAEYALVALRVAVGGHFDPVVQARADAMITDFEMKALEAEMRGQPPS